MTEHIPMAPEETTAAPRSDSSPPPHGEVQRLIAELREANERLVLAGVQFQELSEKAETGRLQADVARAETEMAGEQLRIALEAGHMGTWQYTMSTGETRWSPGLEAIHGYAPGSFPGTFEAFRNEIHPADRERVLEAIGAAVEQRRDHHIEYRIVRSDGTERWVEGRGQLFCDENGRPERMVGVCMDVTERRQAEDKFRLAVEAAPAAMIMVDPGGMIMLVNALTEQLLGFTRHEIVGQPLERLVPPRFRDQHPEYRKSFFGDPVQRPMGAGRELYALRKDGSEVPVEIGLSPLDTVDGQFVLAAVSDITERKEAEKALRDRQEALQEADRRKDEFLAVLAHELRNSLAPIRNAVQILMEKGPPDPVLKWGRDVIDRQVQHMARLLDDLLDVSRITYDKLELRKERVELAAVVRDAIESSRPIIDRCGGQLTVALPTQPVYLEADPERLAQVFSNLLNNAAKYTEPGGHIAIACDLQGCDVVVSVNDDGLGIASEVLPGIFEMFSQGNSPVNGSQGGLGIWLSLVRGLVKLHGGTVEARSGGLGKGSEFIVRLPVVAGKIFQKVARASEDLDETKRHVLIVDDLTDSADSLAMLLRMRGHIVHTAYDGEDAVSVAERVRPDVVLLDIGLPKLNGYDACRRIRQQPWGKDMLLVALTGFGQEEDRRRTADAGFNRHMVKPVDLGELTELLVSSTRETGTS